MGDDAQPAKPKIKPPVVRERSAGVLVFREHSGQTEFLLLDYGRHWDYPKGHLEDGEDDETAARRELREETGIAEVGLVDGFSKEIGYHFRSSRKGLVQKTVIFFLGKLPGDDSGEVALSEEHVGYSWEPLGRALELLTFDNARSVLVAAADHLGLSPTDT